MQFTQVRPLWCRMNTSALPGLKMMVVWPAVTLSSSASLNLAALEGFVASFAAIGAEAAGCLAGTASANAAKGSAAKAVAASKVTVLIRLLRVKKASAL